LATSSHLRIYNHIAWHRPGLHTHKHTHKLTQNYTVDCTVYSMWSYTYSPRAFRSIWDRHCGSCCSRVTLTITVTLTACCSLCNTNLQQTSDKQKKQLEFSLKIIDILYVLLTFSFPSCEYSLVATSFVFAFCSLPLVRMLFDCSTKCCSKFRHYQSVRPLTLASGNSM